MLGVCGSCHSVRSEGHRVLENVLKMAPEFVTTEPNRLNAFGTFIPQDFKCLNSIQVLHCFLCSTHYEFHSAVFILTFESHLYQHDPFPFYHQPLNTN